MANKETINWVKKSKKNKDDGTNMVYMEGTSTAMPNRIWRLKKVSDAIPAVPGKKGKPGKPGVVEKWQIYYSDGDKFVKHEEPQMYQSCLAVCEEVSQQAQIAEKANKKAENISHIEKICKGIVLQSRDLHKLTKYYAVAGKIKTPPPANDTPKIIAAWIEDLRDEMEADGKFIMDEAIIQQAQFISTKHAEIAKQILQNNSRQLKAPLEESKKPTKPQASPPASSGKNTKNHTQQPEKPASKSKPAPTRTRRTGQEIFGCNATSILRWMGRDGFTVKEAAHVMKKMGLEIAMPTVQTQVRVGVNATSDDTPRGPIPHLDKKQADTLRSHKKTFKE